MDIPVDKGFPADAVQCDGCGGHGCECCDKKGWLPAGHRNGRTCYRDGCNNPIPPVQAAVYCSDKCAILDAEDGRVFLSTRVDPELAREPDGHTDPKTRH